MSQHPRLGYGPGDLRHPSPSCPAGTMLMLEHRRGSAWRWTRCGNPLPVCCAIWGDVWKQQLTLGAVLGASYREDS